jgi:hypothetical protein
MSDRFLERVSIKLCVKLGRNTNDTCAMLTEAYWGEAMKKSSVSEWYERFKRIAKTWMMMMMMMMMKEAVNSIIQITVLGPIHPYTQ